VRCGLSSCSRDQICSLPPILLWGWVFTVLVYWGLVCLPCLLLLGQEVIHQLAPCYQCIVMVCWLFFNFVVSFDFGCCSLAQEMSFVDCYLPYFRHLPTVSPSVFSAFIYYKFMWRSASWSSLLFHCAYSTLPTLLMFVFSSLFIFSFVCFVCHAGSHSVQGLCWFILGLAVGIPHDAWCSPVGLPDVSQAGLEPLSGDIGALLFSHCNTAWRSFLWTGGSGCWSFDSSWCFISTKCGSSILARFLIYGVHAVCFCTLVAILDPPVLFS
jgi:hypothetical protein